jgi:hypothetical protein
MAASHKTYVAYTDESGTGEQFLCLGGIFLPKENVKPLEAELEKYCKARGFLDREVSWKKCSATKVKRYMEFAAFFWDLQVACGPLDFRALVVDTHRNPLRHAAWKCNTDEDGFYKFYHHFIAGSFGRVADRAQKWEIVAASLEDQYAYRTEILGTTTAGALRAQFQTAATVTEVRRADPRQARVHQLADLLLGAVSFRFNRPKLEGHKQALCEAVERRVGRTLSKDFFPSVRPFNVWTFAPIGSARWAKGSRGEV